MLYFLQRSTTETFLDGVPEEPSTQRQVVVQHLYVLLGADLLRMEEVVLLQVSFLLRTSRNAVLQCGFAGNRRVRHCSTA